MEILTLRYFLYNKSILFLIAVVTVFYLWGIIAKASADETDQMNWFNDSAFSCFRAAGLDIQKSYCVSESFVIKNDENECVLIYFVFCDGKCIGELLTNEYSESCAFLQVNCEDITDIFLKNVNIAITSPDADHICVVRSDNGKVICVYGNAVENKILGGSIVQFSPIILQPMTIPESLKESESRSVTDESCNLNVPTHGNPVSPDNGYGLCWVSSALSMIEYRQGVTNYTVVDVYDMLKSSYDTSTYGFPVGNSTWILRLFNLFTYSIAYGNTGLYFNSVKGIIDNDKPIFAGLHNWDGSQGHAVVVCGYSRFSSDGLTFHYSYRLCDPNVPLGYVVVSASGSNINITYGQYTQWTSCYY